MSAGQHQGQRCGVCLWPVPDLQPGIPRQPCEKCGSTNLKIGLTGEAVAAATGNLSPHFEWPKDSPSIVLQAILLKGAKTNDGVLIEAVGAPWLAIVRMLEHDPSILNQLRPDQWEELVAGAYKRAGFDSVELTRRSGDHGRDVIATKRGLGSVRVIDQVKAYKPGHLVTADDVRALLGVLHLDGASKGFLTTTSDFAPRLRDDPLIAPLMPKMLELVNGEDLKRRLVELGKAAG